MKRKILYIVAALFALVLFGAGVVYRVYVWTPAPAAVERWLLGGSPHFSCGRGLFKEGAWYGYIDATGAIAIQPQFAAVAPFSEDLAGCWKDGQFGFIDVKGQWVIAPSFAEIRSFSEGLAAVNTGGTWRKDGLGTEGGKWGFVDKSSARIIPAKYDSVNDFHEGLAKFQSADKCGFVNTQGKEVIAAAYDDAGDFSDGLAVVTIEGKLSPPATKCGYIDRDGKIVISIKYGHGGRFSEGLAPVSENKKFGFIDKADRVLIPFQFDRAYSFSDHLALVARRDPVTHDDSIGFIDHTGKIVIPMLYRRADSYHEGLTFVWTGTGAAVIDSTGNEVFKHNYEPWSRFEEGIAWVGENNHNSSGYIDRKGNRLKFWPRLDNPWRGILDR